MIHVKYYIDAYGLTMTGHAESGPAGHDLVCASASTLAYTLANAVEEMKRAGLVKDTVVILEETGAEIACTPAEAYKSIVNVVWNVLCSGFFILADAHPKNIFFEIVERGDRETHT